MQFDHLEARIYWTYMFKLHLRIPLFEYSIKEVFFCGNYFQKLEKPIYKVLNFLGPPPFKKLRSMLYELIRTDLLREKIMYFSYAQNGFKGFL